LAEIKVTDTLGLAQPIIVFSRPSIAMAISH
jgi:hypothetical protein